MGRIKILGVGLSGLVGSRVTELLKDEYDFEDLSISRGVDIRNKKIIFKKIKDSNAKIVLHLAAKTNVDECEKDKKEDLKILEDKKIQIQEKFFEEKNTAWAINVFGAQNVIDACKAFDKKIIYISTDFVFDGINTPKDGYLEEDLTNPINWYGFTKHEAEKMVRDSNIPWLIMRIAYPYRAVFEKSDFVRTIFSKLKKHEELKMVTDHIMTPTFIDNIALALDLLIKNNTHGIFHVVGDSFITPYDASLLIAKIFGFNESLIKKTNREEFFKNRARRPFNLSIKNAKIRKLGLETNTFEEGLQKIKPQLL